MAKKRNRGQVADQGQSSGDLSAGAPEQAGLDPVLQGVLSCLQAGRLVLCVGAGFGQLAGRPTWRELAEKLADTVTDRLADAEMAAEVRELLDTRPLMAASFIKRSLGDRFDGELTRLIPKNGTLPTALAVLPQLPFRAVVTTALDDVVERTYREAQSTAPVYTYRDAEQLRRDGRGRYLLRLFGDPLKGGDVVFGAADLQRLVADPALRGLLGELFQRRSFLFVGFAAEDPDFEALVERLVAVACPAPGTAKHYAVLPGLSRVAREELHAAFGIQVLDEDDAMAVLGALRSALSERGGDALPDDDDLEAWLGLLQQDPERGEVLSHLSELERRYNEEGDGDRLLELLLGRVDVESAAPRRAALLLQVAKVLEEQKGQMAEAFTSALAAYKEDPQAATLDMLERLAGVTGQWVEFLTELREVITALPSAGRVEVWLRIARVYGDKLNHLDYALASLAETKKLDVADEAQRQQLCELQVDLCRRAERWKDLADALGALAALPSLGDNAGRRIDLYLEQGEVFESNLSDGVSAAGAFRRALDVDPKNRDALAALEHLLRRNKRWDELVATLTQKAGLLTETGDGSGALAARREAALLATEHLGDLKGAAERWEEIRRLAPGDLDALRALEKIYGHEGSFSERYLQVLAELADSVPSDKERLALYRRLAAEYEDSPGKSQSAAACLEKILDLDPKAEDAYRGLARLYRQGKSWTLLSDCLRRHAERAASGPAAQAALYAALGQVYAEDIPEGDQARALLAAPQAIEAYATVLRLAPEDQPAMEALTKLYLLTEAFADAVRLLDKRGNISEDRALRATLRHQAAEISLTQLNDPRGAEERLLRALEADAHHLPSLTRLAALYREQGDILRAAKLLQEAAQKSASRLEKTRCLSEAADAYASLGETKRAIELYQQALDADPELAEAGEALVDLLWQEKRFAEAVPVLEMLARKTGDRDEQLGWLNKLGTALRESGDRARALRAFARATELSEGDLTAQRNRAELLGGEGHHQGARDAWMAVLNHGREVLSAGEVVEVLHAVGTCERSLQRLTEARDFFQRALELDPAHRPSLRALIELGDSAGVTREAQVDLRRALLPAAEAEERVKLLTEIGDLQASADPEGALETYKDALSLRPDSHILLHRCLELYSKQHDWSALLTTLERLIELEPNAKRRARYKQTAAMTLREHLKDIPRALTYYNGALDDDPTLEKSALDLEKLAREAGEYRELARLYRRKIKALGPDTEGHTPEQVEKRAERMRLWSALGLVCLEHLGDSDSALAAFEVVAALDRGNLEWRRQIANLHVQTGSLDKAIAEHQAILRVSKGELLSYRALKELYLRTDQREKAAAVAQALVILRKADQSDHALVAETKARPVKPARRALPDDLWRTLAHPDENQQVGALFQTVYPVVQLGYARPFKDAGINRGQPLDEKLLCAKALRYAVEVMGGISIEAYGQPGLKEPHAVVHCGEKGQPPVVCVQLGAPLLSPQRPEAEVLYEVGRLATWLRPRRALRTLLPTASQLGMIIDAALVLAGDQAAATPKVQETLQGLRRALPPGAQEQIAQMGKGLRDAGVRGEPVAASWLAYADITAARAGLVLCGDLEVVAMTMATESAGSSPLSPKQRLLELLHYAVTEEYFAIRRSLGLMG